MTKLGPGKYIITTDCFQDIVTISEDSIITEVVGFEVWSKRWLKYNYHALENWLNYNYNWTYEQIK